MARTVFTATLPNGETVKRTTERRTYTHVVVRHRPEEIGTTCGGEQKVFPDRWIVVGWAGRADLAIKRAASCGGIAIPVNA
jgi:hypothetical protein